MLVDPPFHLFFTLCAFSSFFRLWLKQMLKDQINNFDVVDVEIHRLFINYVMPLGGGST